MVQERNCRADFANCIISLRNGLGKKFNCIIPIVTHIA